ncbi:MAG: prepilin-type N-terminal cleavage/methylation domain-containing protein [Caldisericum sp.]|nr:prepilin-type N-terminal cleavage/methylation domain-containing protein [Caldisericum sp.]
MKRKGFTLIELVVSMALLFIFIYMGFSAFSFVNNISKANQNREAVIENVTTVLDQLTKELRQTLTSNDGSGQFGVSIPAYSSSSSTVRDITNIVDPDPPLSSNQYYTFSNTPILRFYTLDDLGVKHRISYTLGVPTDGLGYIPPHYKGIPRQYWPDSRYEPCEILYSNETSSDNGTTWNGIQNQPITDQVITNFTIIRPSWSSHVIQIVIEAMVKDTSGRATKIIRVAQVTLRQ